MKFGKKFWLVSAATLISILLSSCNLGATPVPTQDTGAIQTQVFNDILMQAASQQTQTALANPTATNTPLPTPTTGFLPTFAPIGGGGATPLAIGTPISGFTPLAPLPTVAGAIPTITTKNGCNDGSYIGETNVANVDWEELKGNTAYSKGWTILNTGTCVWDDGYIFSLVTEFSSPEIRWDKESIIITKKDVFTEPQHSQSFIVKFTTPKAPGRYEAYWKLQDDAKNYFGPMVWIRFTIQ
ncbi:MAG: NBR1-Ig-like domain-containing protein [Anaerolineales bacterium]|nr:NBR1-Ig-like domain-containing protein [Anaerolineales bacterium]